MKAFISYHFNDNVLEILELLQKYDVEVFDSKTDIDYGSSFQKSIKEAIRSCDFIILVYSSPNPNIAFEAGMAVSMNKQIFSIVSDITNEPDFLFESVYVHAKPEEINKIEFNLKIFLEKIKPKKKKSLTTSIKKHKFYGGGYPNYYDKIFNWYKNIDNKSEIEFERFFKKVFELYNLSVIQNKFDSNINFVTDFCIWSDELNKIIGNPILVEIKKELNNKNIITLNNTLTELVNKNTAESCLVFYENLKGINKKELPNTSRYLFIQISDFVEKFKDSDFNNSIRKIRNEIVHNQY